MEKYRVKVRKKGLIVIPAEVRRRLGISEGSYLELYVDNGTIRLAIPKSLKNVFGIDGEKALEVAHLITAARRDEVEKEVRY